MARNQCDGCQAGMPVVNGIHKNTKGHGHMCCQAKRYESDEAKAVKQWLSKPAPIPTPCGCLGERNGEPRCPCGMKWVEKVDGKYFAINEVRSVDGIKVTATYIGDVKHECQCDGRAEGEVYQRQ